VPGSWYDDADLRPTNLESNGFLPLPIRWFPNSPSCAGRWARKSAQHLAGGTEGGQVGSKQDDGAQAEEPGYTVIRFSNAQVLRDPDAVLGVIARVVGGL
jgi:hypothetical protein